MPKQARPSAYRKSYGKEGNYVVVDADVKVMKEAEKDQMKKLNNRLVNYIEKVHDLEIANKILAAENAKLRKMKDTPETDIAAIYDDELDRLRQKVEQLQTANAELEIQKDNLSYDLQEADEKLEETKEENKELEKEVKSLRKDVDDATIERVSLESKIENQQESMELMKQVHEAEMENLRRQIQPVEAPVLNSEQSSILPDLNDAIEKVRRQYEQFNAKSIEDLDNFYKEKVDSLNKQLRAAQAEVRELRADNNEKKKRIHQLEMEIEALRNKNDTLERSIEHLEDRLGREAAENQDLLKQLHDELDSTKQDLGKYLKDYQALNSLKLSLEQEIAIYHKLLTGEESRISEIDTQVVVASRGRTRSRSSSVSSKESRSRSRDSSRKSSRQSSRKSSPERDTGKIVEEMMEKSEPVEGTPPKKEAGTSSKRLSSSSTSSSDSSRHESEIMSGKQDSEKHHENEQLDVAEPGDDVKQEEDEDKPDDDADAEESDGVQDSTALSNGNTTPPKGVISVSWKVKGGTVRPVNPFQPADDAERLRKAMKGIGTDESVIIEILSKRSKIQRQVIAKVYLEKYNDDLLDDLESEVGGNLKAVCQHLMWKRSELDAHAIRKAIKGFGTDEAVLIEILCTQSGREINEIKSDYSRIFEGRDLVKDVEKETSGQFKTFLLAILKANRPPDSGTVVSNVAEEDAKTLFDMGVKNWKPSDPTFLHIFTQRSFQHLWYVFKQCWVKLTTENLMDVVDKECKGDLKKGLQTLIRFSTCIPPSYYAIQIRDVMSGKGTEDKRLIYIITTRSEVDLIDVKEEYSRMYDQDLSKSISDETSGDYKKIMLALVEE